MTANFIWQQMRHSLSAIIAFGMNSAAYVAEIVRSGIMDVDIGQTEASRSLGFNNRQTMTMVVVTHEIGFAKEVASDVVFIRRRCY